MASDQLKRGGEVTEEELNKRIKKAQSRLTHLLSEIERQIERLKELQSKEYSDTKSRRERESMEESYSTIEHGKTFDVRMNYKDGEVESDRKRGDDLSDIII